MTHHFIILHHDLQFSRTRQWVIKFQEIAKHGEITKWWVIIIQHGEISQYGEITMHEYIELCSMVPHTSTTWWNYKAWIYWIGFHGSTYQHTVFHSLLLYTTSARVIFSANRFKFRPFRPILTRGIIKFLNKTIFWIQISPFLFRGVFWHLGLF